MTTAPAAARNKPLARRLAPFAFLMPTLAVLAAGFVAPTFEVLRRSLYQGSIVEDGPFVGLKNYAALISDWQFWRTALITLQFAAGTVVGSLVLGLLVALLLNQRFRGRSVVRMLLIIPWAMPLVPAVLVWRWALDAQYGIVNHLLILAGLISENIAWLNSPVFALPAVILIQIWRTFPFAAILSLAGLQNIEKELYEAAELDGAGVWQRFRFITLPGLRTVLAVLALLNTVWALGADVTVIFLATSGGPAGATRVLSLAAYTEAFQRYDFGQAAAIGTVVLLLSTIPVWLYLRAQGRKDA